MKKLLSILFPLSLFLIFTACEKAEYYEEDAQKEQHEESDDSQEDDDYDVGDFQQAVSLML